MQPACGLAGQPFDVGEKRDHVMARDLLDLVDFGRLEAIAKRRQLRSAVPSGTRPACSMALHAATSTSNQASYLRSWRPEGLVSRGACSAESWPSRGSSEN